MEKYFLGSSTPEGFVTPVGAVLADTENTVYILKGTPGSGKSTLMKKIREAFSDMSEEVYICSSDPRSYDAVYIKDKHAIIIDGTAPHCFDPKYPIAVEKIIDLGEYLSVSKLRTEREEIISLTDKYGTFHARCRLCLSAIASVMTDIMTAAQSVLDKEKLLAFADRTASSITRGQTSAGTGRKMFRQLSAVTFDGYFTILPEDYEITVVNDDCAAAADIFLRRLSDKLCSKGFDVLVSRCLFSADKFYEHIIIPQLGMAFISSSFLNGVKTERRRRTVYLRRFYDNEALDSSPDIKTRIKFGKKTALEFMKEAAGELRTAKSVHDDIESHYISAADFDGINRLTYKLISEIKSL